MASDIMTFPNTIYVVETLQAPKGKGPELRTALQALVQVVRQKPGPLFYNLYQDLESPAVL